MCPAVTSGSAALCQAMDTRAVGHKKLERYRHLEVGMSVPNRFLVNIGVVD